MLLEDFLLNLVEQSHEVLFKLVVVLKILSKPIDVKCWLIHNNLLLLLVHVVLSKNIDINLLCVTNQILNELISEPQFILVSREPLLRIIGVLYFLLKPLLEPGVVLVVPMELSILLDILLEFSHNMRVFVDARRFLGFLKQFLRLFYRQFAHWGISELHLVELHREFHLGGSLFQN